MKYRIRATHLAQVEYEFEIDDDTDLTRQEIGDIFEDKYKKGEVSCLWYESNDYDIEFDYLDFKKVE